MCSFRVLGLLIFIIHANVQAQDAFESMLNEYATCAIEYTQSKEDQMFIAEETRSSCRQQVDMIEMMVTVEMAQPILAEVEIVVIERLAQ